MHRRTCRADGGLAEVKRKRQQTRQLILLTTKNWNDRDADMELSSHVRVMITIAMLLGLRASEILGLRSASALPH
jgi:hypothetical protein